MLANDDKMQLIDLFTNKEYQHELKLFMGTVHDFFSRHPVLSAEGNSLIHSVKARIKDQEHLSEKITRKISQGKKITTDNLFKVITDLSGVRILHLYLEQFPAIHKVILDKCECGDWFLNEEPKAYTWDPETETYFKSLSLKVERRDTYYTSIHYVIRPKRKSHLVCEVQVRTLFEEIWGEVDHSINYPNPTGSLPCREQLRVLAKLVGAGSRLVDSIYRSIKAE